MADEKEPSASGSKLRLVAENSQATVDRERDRRDVRLQYRMVEINLQNLAANIIRVVRGAGKPEDILLQANDLMKSLVEYQKRCGEFPDPKLFAGSLSISRDPEYPGGDEVYYFHSYVREDAIRHSLQMAACRIKGHDALENKTKGQLDDVFRSHRQFHEKLAEQRRREERERSRVKAKRVKGPKSNKV